MNNVYLSSDFVIILFSTSSNSLQGKWIYLFSTDNSLPQSCWIFLTFFIDYYHGANTSWKRHLARNI